MRNITSYSGEKTLQKKSGKKGKKRGTEQREKDEEEANEEEEKKKEEEEEDGYPRRLDQASMTVHLSVGMDEKYPVGSQEMAAEATARPPIAPLSLSLSGQIR